MKQLASYSLEATSSDLRAGAGAAGVVERVETWLRSKGSLAEDGQSIALSDGRVARVDRVALNSTRGRLTEVVVTEPRTDGWFRTAIAVAETDGSVAISVGLSAAALALAPVYVDVRCPRLVRDLISPPSAWHYRGTRLTSSPIDLKGEAGGERFIALTWDPARSVPVVAVSDEYGSVLHPGVVESLAADLAGLAVVARLDPQASWRVTGRKGKEWSCYGGAIRLFWPQIADSDSPYRHPLWTPTRLLGSTLDTETAAERIRRELRRRILGQSAFAITDAPALPMLRRAAREEELAAIRAKATDHADYKALADEYFEAAARANELIAERDAEVEELRAKIRGLQYALQSKREDHEEIAPDTETPPSTVEEAVLVAMEALGDDLEFGGAVSEGIGTLAKDAGPPDKILRYLRVVAEFSRARRVGPLGVSAITWLQDRGVTASTESETVRNAGGRIWDDANGERRAFDLHLKPSDATAPDRCVRIYFDYDEKRKKTVVGWVGRHP
jgi:hypothetical protein